jgi:hypothetical protein
MAIGFAEIIVPGIRCIPDVIFDVIFDVGTLGIVRQISTLNASNVSPRNFHARQAGMNTVQYR